ncbi:MAG: sugar ABC transporter permease [Acidobacteria bacterium 37-71-11]|nr:MAG: sugar ABC transporter permease [Acidobacteria bacterium 37-71-11]HQT95055.1 sugar ABC transporter permease [Thermoanaerobaculaceae bacterium]
MSAAGGYRSSRSRREARAGLAFITPALALIAVFFVVPVVVGFLLAATDFDIYAVGDLATARFVGLGNFAALFHDPVFWKALGNTFYFVLVGGPLSVAVSLAAALLVNARLVRFKGLFRTVYFAPVVTTMVAVAVVWRYLYHPRFGLLNQLLALGGLGPVNWLGDPRWAMPAVILMAVWKNFGYNMIIFVAGLQSVPATIYEAARVDGAGPWRQFRHLTLPALRPMLVFVGVITMVGYFQLFTEPYVMTNGGGPLNATLSIVMYMYKQGFRWWNIGFGAAVALVLFLIILAGTLVQLRLQKGRE